MDYEEFKEKLIVFGFEVDWHQMPFMRVEYPQLMVSWINHPLGIHLQVKNKPNESFKTLRIETINYFEETLKQIEFTIEKRKT